MRILLAIDDSKFSEAAAQAVVAQARRPDAEVRVLHVIEPPTILVAREMGTYASAMEAEWQKHRKQAEELVANTAKILREAGLKASTAVEQGDPKSRILDTASEWPADLIVLGSHGRKGLDRFLLGSVSEAVVRHAPCSVEIVRIRSGQ